jgi:hypothetical protein
VDENLGTTSCPAFFLAVIGITLHKRDLDVKAGRVAVLRGPRVAHVGSLYSDSSGATVLTRDISVVPGMHGLVERYYTVLTSSLAAIPTAWLCIMYAPSSTDQLLKREWQHRSDTH